ncbi:uncharacterized protein [Panulirus ornatus]|uniref:uncharacterized protein n=1 Tax=Panulirus ornatus TaxID=150431 RepID=UPI003A857D83
MRATRTVLGLYFLLPPLCLVPTASSEAGGTTNATVKVFGLQEDIWSSARDDVLLRYNLSTKGYEASEDVSICLRLQATSLATYEIYVSMAAGPQSQTESLLWCKCLQRYTSCFCS